MENPILNEHNKQEFAPAHTALSHFLGKVALLFLSTLLATNLLAQEKMTPSRIHTRVTGEYEPTLFELFKVSDAKDFVYFVIPSFDSEYCLSYDRMTKSLKLKRAQQNIWFAKKRYNSDQKDVPLMDYSLNISDSLLNSLVKMFNATVLTSSFISEIRGNDGTTYKFMIDPWWAESAECWSPEENTNCGQAVSVMEKLCEAVKTGDKDAAEGLIEEIERVTKLFEQYYPAGFDPKKRLYY